MISKISAFKIVLILMAMVLYAACSDSGMDTPAAAYPAKISVVDGVRTVLNPDYPRDGRVTYDMIEELSVGASGENEQALLSGPHTVRVAENGDMYVLDWQEVNVKVFDKNGCFIRTIGRKGQGPGEFSVPCYFCLTSKGEICVLDTMGQKVSLLDVQGKFIKSIPLPGFCNDLESDSGHGLISHTSTYPSMKGIGEAQVIQWVYNFHRIDLDEGSSSKLFDFKGDQSVLVLNNDVTGWYETCWAAHKRGCLSIGHNQTYEICTYDNAGRLQLKYERAFKPIILKPGKRDPKDPNYKVFMERDKFHPKFEEVFSSFLVDENDNLWVMINSGHSEKARVYDVFDPEGIYVRQVRTELPINCFKHGRAYSIIYSRDGGFPVIKRFRLEERLGKT